MTDGPIPNHTVPQVPIELKERALAAAGEGITIVDARLPGMPLIYVNPAFEQLTGYTREEALGYNCRFLQGPDTDPKVSEAIKAAISEQSGCVVEILNYRKDGTRFWNRLSITPVRDAKHEVTHYIGVQSDVTARRLAEERLTAATCEMRRELEAAARIQQSLLPTDIPKLAGMELGWHYRPSRELGGDTLNILRLADHTIALYLMDVSGHGVTASLLSFALAHTLSPQPERSFLFSADGDNWKPASPAAVACRLNQRFMLDPEAPQFFTMFYALLDERTSTLRAVIAGHPPVALIRADGTVSFIYSTEPPIGVVAGIGFTEQEIALHPGDRLYAFTDGLSEALSPAGEQLEFERIGEAAVATRGGPIADAVRALVSLAEDWTGGEPQDDVSVLAVGRVELTGGAMGGGGHTVPS